MWKSRATLHLACAQSHSKSQGCHRSPEVGEQQERTGAPGSVEHPSASTTVDAQASVAASTGPARRTPPIGSAASLSSEEAAAGSSPRNARAPTGLPASLTVTAEAADAPEAPLNGVQGGRRSSFPLHR
ncbi:hypothetical protein NDU88_003780 [Pleurodeles waltl]|uniref:Uncharacterized protein n=1 Tax=Pleurodeles waltl TaxID=8319 RepID=A0AAV7UFA3_PLEWA|nr:hypothetical protein NDU88_003780 [Pleurodeles waltl]